MSGCVGVGGCVERVDELRDPDLGLPHVQEGADLQSGQVDNTQ